MTGVTGTGNLDNYTVDNAGCWVWLGATHRTGGYGYIRYGGRNIAVHRFQYERHIGPIPRGHQLHHRCGVRACCNPAHMEPIEPTAHLRLNGKLTLQKARHIRRLAREGVSTNEIARRFGVNGKTTRDVLTGKTWREAPESTWVCGPFASALEEARARVTA